MNMKCLRLAASALMLSDITVVASNLRQSKHLRLFDPKAGKADYADKLLNAKATRSGKSTLMSDCGEFWHRSQSPLNPSSCTNDDNLPEDPSHLYLTVEGKRKHHFCLAFANYTY
jgi:hypothetical protein